MISNKTFVARTLFATGTASVALFTVLRLAAADPGASITPDALTYAGVLRSPPTTPAPLTFEFVKGGATVCTTTTAPVTFDSSGAFSVAVPLGSCPRSIFDGDTVTYNVLLGSEMLASNVAITAVPYARYAESVGTPECPAGYTRFTETATVSPSWIVCRRLVGSTVADEVVRVGDGPSAFWVDRYEATVWTTRNGPAGGTRIFGSATDMDSSAFPRSGQWRPAGFTTPPAGLPSAPAYALSVAGHRPASWITWFQAEAACRAAGKRLPSGPEWLAAAQGTNDPGPNAGEMNNRCNTMGVGPRNTGGGAGCRSAWGAQDMIGNIDEWTAEWFVSTGTMGFASAAVWPGADYNSDVTANIANFVAHDNGNANSLPAAVTRGNIWRAGTGAGIFSLDASSAPSNYNQYIGFRCVVPR